MIFASPINFSESSPKLRFATPLNPDFHQTAPSQRHGGDQDSLRLGSLRFQGKLPEHVKCLVENYCQEQTAPHSLSMATLDKRHAQSQHIQEVLSQLSQTTPENRDIRKTARSYADMYYDSLHTPKGQKDTDPFKAPSTLQTQRSRRNTRLDKSVLEQSLKALALGEGKHHKREQFDALEQLGYRLGSIRSSKFTGQIQALLNFKNISSMSVKKPTVMEELLGAIQRLKNKEKEKGIEKLSSKSLLSILHDTYILVSSSNINRRTTSKIKRLKKVATKSGTSSEASSERSETESITSGPSPFTSFNQPHTSFTNPNLSDSTYASQQLSPLRNRRRTASAMLPPFLKRQTTSNSIGKNDTASSQQTLDNTQIQDWMHGKTPWERLLEQTPDEKNALKRKLPSSGTSTSSGTEGTPSVQAIFKNMPKRLNQNHRRIIKKLKTTGAKSRQRRAKINDLRYSHKALERRNQELEQMVKQQFS